MCVWGGCSLSRKLNYFFSFKRSPLSRFPMCQSNTIVIEVESGDITHRPPISYWSINMSIPKYFTYTCNYNTVALDDCSGSSFIEPLTHMTFSTF